MPINNKRAAEQVEQEARKSQAKSFRTNATSTTDQGKGPVAKIRQSKQQARKSQAKSFRTDASPTTDQGKGSVAETETIQTIMHEEARQRAFEQMRVRRQTKEKDQSPNQKTVQTEPKRNVLNIGQCRPKTENNATLQDVTDTDHHTMFSLIKQADRS